MPAFCPPVRDKIVPVPQKPHRWVHDGLRRELPAEEAFEARVKRSAFSNLLQNEERLCLDAIVKKWSGGNIEPN